MLIYVLRCRPSYISERHKKHKLYLEGPLQICVLYADRKSKMATTAMHRLTLDPMGKLIIFVVSEKKAFEHFPIGSNVNLCPAVVAILNFRSAYY
jgi:hypothetical protein